MKGIGLLSIPLRTVVFVLKTLYLKMDSTIVPYVQETVMTDVGEDDVSWGKQEEIEADIMEYGYRPERDGQPAGMIHMPVIDPMTGEDLSIEEGPLADTDFDKMEAAPTTIPPNNNNKLFGEEEVKEAFEFAPPGQGEIQVNVAKENEQMGGIIAYPKLEGEPTLVEYLGRTWMKMVYLNVTYTTCITKVSVDGRDEPLSMFSCLLYNPTSLPTPLWVPWPQKGLFAQTKVAHAESNEYTRVEDAIDSKTGKIQGAKVTEVAANIQVTVHPDWVLVDYFTSMLIGSNVDDVKVEFYVDPDFPLRLEKIIVYETPEHVARTRQYKQDMLTRFYDTMKMYYEKVVEPSVENLTEKERKEIQEIADKLGKGEVNPDVPPQEPLLFTSDMVGSSSKDLD